MVLRRQEDGAVGRTLDELLSRTAPAADPFGRRDGDGDRSISSDRRTRVLRFIDAAVGLRERMS